MTPAGQLLRRQFQLAHQLLEAGGLVSYTRAVLAEDVTVNCMLAGGQPLAFSDWPCLGAYARAVYAATDAYLDSVGKEDVDLLTALLLTHARRAGAIT